MSYVYAKKEDLVSEIADVLRRSDFSWGVVEVNPSYDLARVIVDRFFLVPREEIPGSVIDTKELTALYHPYVYPGMNTINEYWKPDEAYNDVISAIANYLSAEHLQVEIASAEGERAKDKDLAFKLFKASDPRKGHYSSFENIPVLEQHRWLTVAQKAREELES